MPAPLTRSPLFPYTTRFRSRVLDRPVAAGVVEDKLDLAEVGRPAARAAGEQHVVRLLGAQLARRRSEEHTSELQSPCNLVCRLLLEKQKREQPRTNPRLHRS